MPQRIDSHQHFWRLARGDYGWLRADVPALAPLLRDFLPDDLRASLTTHGVAQTVLVQAAQSVAETDFLLQLAAKHDWVAGVVGWVDLSDPASVGTLERLAQSPKLKSIRPVLQDLPEADWIARAPHPEVMRSLGHLGLRFDALVQPWHLQPLLQFLRRHPELPVAIDHAAKPQLAAGWGADWAPQWLSGMAEIATHPQVVCKFSGLLTEAAPASIASTVSATDAVRPVWDCLLQWFGPERLMWGSDWPVLTLAADYARWVAACERLIGELHAEQQAQVWHGTAQSFYGLTVDAPVN